MPQYFQAVLWVSRLAQESTEAEVGAGVVREGAEKILDWESAL